MDLKRHMTKAMAAKQAGKRYAVPEAGMLLWSLYWQIAATRTYHSAGPNPISYQEIAAYCRLHRWPLQPHHIGILRAIDDTLLEGVYDATAVKLDVPSVAPKPLAAAQPITVAAFDAVFGG